MKKILLNVFCGFLFLLSFVNFAEASRGILGEAQRVEDDINKEWNRFLWGSPNGGSEIVDFGISGGGGFNALWENTENGGADIPDGSFELPDSEKFNEIGESTDIREFILKVVNYALTFLGIICVIFIIYAGFLYVTAGGDDGQTDKAKKIIIYVAIGIIIILASFAIVNTVIKSGTGDPEEIDNYNTGGGSSTSGYSDEYPEPPGYSGDWTQEPYGEVSVLSRGPLDISGNNVVDYGNGVIVGGDRTIDLGTSLGDKPALCDFGDGVLGEINPETGKNTVKHTYASEGNYTIRCVIEIDGELYRVSQNVMVGGLEAIISIQPSEARVREKVEFYGSKSKNPVGQLTTIEWSCKNSNGGTDGCFNNGQTYDELDFFVANDYAFTKPGIYAITLKIENNVYEGAQGMSDETTENITILPEGPTVGHKIIVTKVEGKPTTFKLKSVGGLNIQGGDSGLRYHWTFYDPDGEIMDVEKTYGSEIKYEFPEIAHQTYRVELVVSQNYKGHTIYSDQENPASATIEIGSILPVDFDFFQ